MQEIIAINKSVIGAEEVNSVNSREIYDYLEVSEQYSDWIQRTIEKYDFVENEDYLSISEKSEKGGRPRKDYIVTLDVAKELCMVSNTPKGRETRKYFIAKEKEANQPKILTLEDLVHQSSLLVQKKIEEQEQKLTCLESKVSETLSIVNKKVSSVTEKQYVPKGFIPIGVVKQHWETGLSKEILKRVARIYNVETTTYIYQNEDMYKPQEHLAYRANDLQLALIQFSKTLKRYSSKFYCSPQIDRCETRFKVSPRFFELYDKR
jgi:phage anti-repressor protein